MTLKPDQARFSDKAVEAGARAVFSIRENGTPLLKEKDVIRTALRAALPVLLEGKRDVIMAAISEAIHRHSLAQFQAAYAADRIISILTGESE